MKLDQNTVFGVASANVGRGAGQAALDAWVAEPLDFAPPGGESPRRMADRALDFLAELRAEAAVALLDGRLQPAEAVAQLMGRGPRGELCR